MRCHLLLPLLMAAVLSSALFTSADTVGATAAQPVGEQQLSVWRGQFQQALGALKKGRTQEFLRLEKGLQRYPLAAYLRFAWLSSRLDSTPAPEIEQFLTEQRGTRLSGRLRRAWLKTLAKQRDWGQFLQAYADSQSTTLRCYKARAELAQLGRRAPPLRLFKDMEALYLVGRSQPSACDPVFKALKDYGRLDDALLWRRIALALKNGQTSLAAFLQRSLKSADKRRWVDLWLAMRKQPAQTLDGLQWPDGPEARELLVYGVQRLADRDAAQAHRVWALLRGRYAWAPGQRDTVDAAIARHAALQRLPEAGAWLAALTNPGESDRAWAVRAALWQQDWQGVLDAIKRLSAKQRGQDHWRYWQARALQALGRPGHQALYAKVAADRGYHSFLAADRIGQSYRLNDHPLNVSQKLLRELTALPGIQRARELLRLQRTWEARSEWNGAIAGLDKARLRAAAQLAYDWGWYDQAILTVAKAGDRDALALRFPLAYRSAVESRAASQGLNPSWVYAVIRQESRFVEDVASPAGALGLMQLMPATGRETARRLGLRVRHSRQLKQADHNVHVGSAYLKRLYRRLHDNPVLATAAYNAGPNRVRAWLPDQVTDAPLWLETIPYRETRRYVRKVLANAVIYDWRLGRKPITLKRRMPKIPSGK